MMALEGSPLNVLPAVQVSLFSENSIRWLLADQAVMMNGAIDAVSPPLPMIILSGSFALQMQAHQSAGLFFR